MSKVKEWNLLDSIAVENEQLHKDKDLGKLNLTLTDKVYIQSEEEIKQGYIRFTEATDYARTCGYGNKLNMGNPIDSCKIATRTPSQTLNHAYKIYDTQIGDYSGSVSAYDIGIQPVIHLTINNETIKYFKENIFHEKEDGIDRFILPFGEYPQSKVRSEQGELLEYLYETKQLSNELLFYTGFYSKEEKIVRNNTFSYEGNLYVRAKPKLDDLSRIIKYSDGSIINHKDNAGSYVWHKVEPIEWEILNWNNLPPSINPNGNGTENYLKLRSTKALISGIPFYPRFGSRELATNSSYYQNSLIRAFLNGYNIQYEIDHRLNGAKEVISDKNFTQLYSDFISSAFNKILEMEQTNMTDIISHIESKKNKVKIIDTPLSIDEQIKFYIDNGLPFMLHGKSGIGKSRRVADIDPDYFLLTLRNGMMPEEILGKECPNPNGVGTKWYAPSWYNDLCDKCKSEPDKNHILFIDELTNVNEYEQSLVYHIVLNHSLGVTSGKLPENCVVVAAGNSKDESNSAYNMSEPLFRRFHGHIYLPLDLDSLLEWGSEPRKDNPEQTNLHPLVSRFISTYPKTLYTEYDPDKTGKNFAIDPRAWEQVSDIIYHNDNAISRELLNNKIGEVNSTMFIEFAQKDFITIDEILTDSFDPTSIPRKLDEQYALVLQLRHANEQEIKKVREFIADNLSGETLAKFDYIWVGNNPERALIIDELKEDYHKRKPKESSPKKHKNRAIPFSQFLGQENAWTDITREDKMAINCNSAEKAELLCKALTFAGKAWRKSGVLCGVDTHYQGHDTCYTNNGTIGSYSDMIENGIVVYDMRYIDMEGYLSEENLARLDELIEQDGYKRININDFVGGVLWNNYKRRDPSYIHCKNEYYAEILCEAFNRLGVRWDDCISYKTDNRYSTFLDKSCYSNNGGIHSYTNVSNNRECPIYDFVEVDFSGVFSPSEIEDIEEIIEKNDGYKSYKHNYTIDDVEDYFNKLKRLSPDNLP